MRDLIKLTKDLIKAMRKMIVEELPEEELGIINSYNSVFTVFDLFIEHHPKQAEDLKLIFFEDGLVSELLDDFLDEVEEELLPDNFYQD